MKRIEFLSVLFAFAFLAGCGDDQINEITEVDRLGLDVVSEAKDLPDCDSDIEGKVAWVTEEDRYYACTDGEWVAYAEGNTPKEHSIECSTKKLEDGSGVKVICNGDSIGALQYGADAGIENVKSKKACTLQMLESDSLKLECGSSSRLMSIDELLASMGESYEVVMDSEQVAVRLENIGGYSQKGPFLTGSEVVAYEIENGRTLKQTGTKFEGRISKDDGSFNIRSVKLASQYGFVTVNGFYRNEVTGAVSDVRISLNAISDFRNRNRVNVNVLTHMEYERILHLVTKEMYRFADAKKKAEQEIWKIFRIDDEGFSDGAEDLNIAGSNDDDAALLAVSILLQRNGDAGDMLSLVTSIGNAVAKEGKWENDSLEAAIADWSLRMDVNGGYETIKRRVAGWGLSVNVPDFAKYLRNYWQAVLGVPACTADNEDTVVFISNKKSAYYSTDGSRAAFKCSADMNRWTVLSDNDLDILNWNDTLDGTIKSGNLNSDVIYVFDSTGAFNGEKGWRRTVDAAERTFGGCRKDVFGDSVYVKEYGKKYVCDEKSHLWVGTWNYSVIDTSAWPENSDGDVWIEMVQFEEGTYPFCYVYDEYTGRWRNGSTDDCDLGLMGCTINRIGEISYSSSTQSYYKCEYVANTNNNTGYYSMNANTEESCEIYCSVADSVLKLGGVKTCRLEYTDFNSFVNYFYGSEESFMKAYNIDEIEDSLYTKKYPFCSLSFPNPSWKQISKTEVDSYGKDCNGRETFWGIINPENLYVCKDGTMQLVSDMERMLGQYCYESVIGSLTSNYKYVCKDTSTKTWTHGTDWVLAEIFDVPYGRVNYFNETLDYGELEDPRDGKIYKTIHIEGSGTWMAENLNFRDEDKYYSLRNHISCLSRDDSACSYLGTEYLWNAAMNIDSKWDYASASEVGGIIMDPHQGVCPDGWHIPTEDEWLGLVKIFYPQVSSFEDTRVDMSMFLARNVNEWANATNESGLTILPMFVSGVYFDGRLAYVSNFVATSNIVAMDEDRFFVDKPSYRTDMGRGAVRCKKDAPVEESGDETVVD